MAQKKIDKEFCLTDNSVNVYGYRLLTEGLQKERFNPAIGFLMHKRESGVAVRWEDFRVEADKLFAKPVINESLFPDLAAQIEEGFYSAASVGHIVAIELTDDPKMKLPGQIGPTVTKWFPRECSVVDIPGNYNALAKLYDVNDNVLHDLSANQEIKFKKSMDENFVTATVLALLNLKADATAEQFNSALVAVIEKSKKVELLETELNNLKATKNATEVDDIIKKAMSERKITKELAETLKKDYANNPSGLQALVAVMTPQNLVTDKINKEPAGLPEKFRNKSFDDLYVDGSLEELQANYPEYYSFLKTK